MRDLRTALFIDFDNISISLDKMEDQNRTSFGLSDIFGFESIHWIGGLDDALPQWNEGQDRRILVQRCYLNPQAFWQQRQRFSDAGFQCIDCPPMTKGGKTAADMYMAMHILDCLNHPTGYDEFVICSGDADFSPIVRRLREYGKRVILVLSGPGSQAYLNSADYVISASEFANILLESVSQPEPPKQSRPNAAKGISSELEEVRKLAEAILAESPTPIRMAKFMHLLNRQRTVALHDLDYLGYGKATNLLRQIESERLQVINSGNFDFIYNPQKHQNPLESETDIVQSHDDDAVERTLGALPVVAPRQESPLSPLLLDVCRATGAPRLNSKEFRAIFSAIQEFKQQNEIGTYNLNQLSIGVRDEASRQMGYTIGRNPISWTLMSINFGGIDLLRHAAPDLRSLGQACLKNVIALCGRKNFELSPEAQREIQKWITQAL